MKTFKDICKGDRIRWRASGVMEPERIGEGVARKFIKGNKELADVWMCSPPESLVPVTPSSFRGFVRVREKNR